MKNGLPPLRAQIRHNPLVSALVFGLGVLWLVTAVSPHDRFDWLLENLLVFVFVAILIGARRRLRLSSLSYSLLALFACFHFVGAHYTYAETPLGFWLQDLGNLERNHYDRLVHFAFGLLWVYPLREALDHAAGLRSRWGIGIAVTAVAATSALYETIEALVAMLVSPQLGAAYLGTQGDVWDAQWDMAAAMGGGVVAAVITWVREARREAPRPRWMD